MAGKHLTYFVSDVHLGLDVKDSAGREKRFADFLLSIDPAGTDAVYLLGDIWDFWYEYRDVVPKGYVRVLAALVGLVDAGVKVYFFQGNHDVWTYGYFEELGMKKLEQPHVAQIGGRTFCIGHGDGLGPVPRGYRFLRGMFHCRFLQILFSMLHPWLAFRIGHGWSKNNRLARREKYVFNGAAEPLWQFAEDFARKRPVDFFVFGHYHCTVDETLPSGARLFVLPDWIDSPAALVFDSDSGEASLD